MSRALIAFVALLLPVWAMAAGTCYQYRLNASTAWRDSLSEVGSDYATWCNANPASGGCGCDTSGGKTCTFSNGRAVAGSPAPPNYNIIGDRNQCLPPGSGGTCTLTVGQSYGSVLNRTNPSGCPDCEEAGKEAFIGGGAASASGTTCVQGCLYNTPAPSLKIYASGAASPTIYKAYSMGTACAASDGYEQGASRTDCDATGTICRNADATGKNCGTYNGDRVCVSAVPANTCVEFASGGVACMAASSGGTATPPDNGTAGMPATPTMKVSENGKTVNYYNSTVVNSSTVTVSTGNPQGGDPLTNGGSGSGGEGGSLDDLEGGELGTVGDYGESASGFYASIEGAPIVAAVSAIAGSIGTASCPSWSTTVDAGFTSFDVDFSIVCTLWDDIAGVIGAVMLCVWALAGIKILMSA